MGDGGTKEFKRNNQPMRVLGGKNYKRGSLETT